MRPGGASVLCLWLLVCSTSGSCLDGNVCLFSLDSSSQCFGASACRNATSLRMTRAANVSKALVLSLNDDINTSASVWKTVDFAGYEISAVEDTASLRLDLQRVHVKGLNINRLPLLISGVNISLMNVSCVDVSHNKSTALTVNGRVIALDRVRVANSAGTGIVIGADSEDVKITAAEVTNSGVVGLWNMGQGTRLTNSVFAGNHAGVRDEGRGMVIASSSFVNTTVAGIDVEGQGCVIGNCTFANALRSVNITGSSQDTVIHSSSFHAMPTLGQNETQIAQILAQNGAEGVVIGLEGHGNTFHGDSVVSKSRNITIQHNVFYLSTAWITVDLFAPAVCQYNTFQELPSFSRTNRRRNAIFSSSTSTSIIGNKFNTRDVVHILFIMNETIQVSNSSDDAIIIRDNSFQSKSYSVLIGGTAAEYYLLNNSFVRSNQTSLQPSIMADAGSLVVKDNLFRGAFGFLCQINCHATVESNHFDIRRSFAGNDSPAAQFLAPTTQARPHRFVGNSVLGGQFFQLRVHAQTVVRDNFFDGRNFSPLQKAEFLVFVDCASCLDPIDVSHNMVTSFGICGIRAFSRASVLDNTLNVSGSSLGSFGIVLARHNDSDVRGNSLLNAMVGSKPSLSRGIYLHLSHNVTIANNSFVPDNTFMFIVNSIGITITNNTALACTPDLTFTAFLRLQYSKDIVLADNQICGAGYVSTTSQSFVSLTIESTTRKDEDWALLGRDSHDIEIRDCQFRGTRISFPTIVQNILLHNCHVDSSYIDVFLSDKLHHKTAFLNNTMINSRLEVTSYIERNATDVGTDVQFANNRCSNSSIQLVELCLGNCTQSTNSFELRENHFFFSNISTNGSAINAFVSNTMTSSDSLSFRNSYFMDSSIVFKSNVFLGHAVITDIAIVGITSVLVTDNQLSLSTSLSLQEIAKHVHVAMLRNAWPCDKEQRQASFYAVYWDALCQQTVNDCAYKRAVVDVVVSGGLTFVDNTMYCDGQAAVGRTALVADVDGVVNITNTVVWGMFDVGIQLSGSGVNSVFLSNNTAKSGSHFVISDSSIRRAAIGISVQSSHVLCERVNLTDVAFGMKSSDSRFHVSSSFFTQCEVALHANKSNLFFQMNTVMEPADLHASGIYLFDSNAKIDHNIMRGLDIGVQIADNKNNCVSISGNIFQQTGNMKPTTGILGQSGQYVLFLGDVPLSAGDENSCIFYPDLSSNTFQVDTPWTLSISKSNKDMIWRGKNKFAMSCRALFNWANSTTAAADTFAQASVVDSLFFKGCGTLSDFSAVWLDDTCAMTDDALLQSSNDTLKLHVLWASLTKQSVYVFISTPHCQPWLVYTPNVIVPTNITPATTSPQVIVTSTLARPSASQSQSSQSQLAAIIAGTCSAVLLFCIMLVYLVRRKRTIRVVVQRSTILEAAMSKFMDSTALSSELADAACYSLESKCAPASAFNLHTILGEGQYGKVFKATLKHGLLSRRTVAVKTLHVPESISSSDAADMSVALMMEALTLCCVSMSPFVCQVEAVCSQDSGPLLAIEYMPEGSLDNYLKKEDKQQLMVKQGTLSYVNGLMQIGSGLLHIHDCNLVHRDLAARNVLVKTDRLYKIGDFGMTRFMNLGTHAMYYKQQSQDKSPFRWMAPESLRHRKFSKASDVWAFGVTAWELFTHADVPYEGRGPTEVIQDVMRGTLLQYPDNCPRELAEILLMCFHKEASKRPPMRRLSDLLNAYRETLLQVARGEEPMAMNVIDFSDQETTL